MPTQNLVIASPPVSPKLANVERPPPPLPPPPRGETSEVDKGRLCDALDGSEEPQALLYFLYSSPDKYRKSREKRGKGIVCLVLSFGLLPFDPDELKPFDPDELEPFDPDELEPFDLGEGGVETCGPNRRLPLVQLKKSVRRFWANGVRLAAGSMIRAASALFLLKNDDKDGLAYRSGGVRGRAGV